MESTCALERFEDIENETEIKIFKRERMNNNNTRRSQRKRKSIFVKFSFAMMRREVCHQFLKTLSMAQPQTEAVSTFAFV